MRKRLISTIPHNRLAFDGGRLDLANLGMVEITSEDAGYPIECALQVGETRVCMLLSLDLRSSDFCSTSDKPQTYLVGFRGNRKASAHKRSS